jgi:uncharacterized protein
MVNMGNLQQAQEYVRNRLERELPPGLFYHRPAHTIQDVVPAAQRLAFGEGVDGEPLHLLQTAAWFHDIGFIETRAGHEAISARIASEVLPGFGYSPAQVEIVLGIIGATVLPQSPVTILQQIMADADLDVLGREDYTVLNGELRRELAFYGQESSDSEWYVGQMEFLGGHSYFTASAHSLRDAGKLANMAHVQRILDQLNNKA